jgi:hypothetical protein
MAAPASAAWRELLLASKWWIDGRLQRMFVQDPLAAQQPQPKVGRLTAPASSPAGDAAVLGRVQAPVPLELLV